MERRHALDIIRKRPAAVWHLWDNTQRLLQGNAFSSLRPLAISSSEGYGASPYTSLISAAAHYASYSNSCCLFAELRRVVFSLIEALESVFFNQFLKKSDRKPVRYTKTQLQGYFSSSRRQIFSRILGQSWRGKEFLCKSNKRLPWGFNPFSEAQTMVHLLGLPACILPSKFCRFLDVLLTPLL